LKILAKNGKIQYPDPISGRVTEPRKNGNGFLMYRINGNNRQEIIRYKTQADAEGQIIMRFSTETENSDLQKLIIGCDTSKIELINPKFIELFPELRIVMICSFVTTDETNFILSAVDFSGRLLWQRSQVELKGSDFYSRHPHLDVALKYDNNLLFNSGGFVYYLDVAKNSVLWKTRF